MYSTPDALYFLHLLLRIATVVHRLVLSQPDVLTVEPPDTYDKVAHDAVLPEVQVAAALICEPDLYVAHEAA